MTVALNLPELHAQLLRTITLARKAHDEYIAAYGAAGGRDEQHRLAAIGQAIADTINAAQGCLYTVSYAMRNAGTDFSTGPCGPQQESNDGRTDRSYEGATAPGAAAVGGAGAEGRDPPRSRGGGDAGGNRRAGSGGTPVGGAEAGSLTGQSPSTEGHSGILQLAGDRCTCERCKADRRRLAEEDEPLTPEWAEFMQRMQAAPSLAAMADLMREKLAELEER